ncbi:TPA: PcfJ domain-containing protein, partial [Campylobacter fetus subsp. venerealis]|nr:PcfJ domain-containing protein [Campylobacter fetus subsp. venerealis]
EANAEGIIRDYVNMATTQEGNINLKIKSFKRLRAEHDRLMLNIRIEKAPEVKISDENSFLKLKLPCDIKMLTTKKEIVEESIANHNCVASYIQRVNAQKCFICSLRRDNERYTIEIRRQRNKFYLAQIKGFSNSEPPNEIVEYVNNAILANNKRTQQIQ